MLTLLLIALALLSAPAVAWAAAVPPDPGWWVWLLSNSDWLLPLALVLVSSLATGLTRYPRAGEAVYWMRWLAGLLSLVSHRDTAGLFGRLTLPFVPQSPPRREDGVATGDALAVGAIAAIIGTLVAAALLAGCGGLIGQVQSDVTAVAQECLPSAAIELSRCTSRTTLARMCERARDRGVRLPHPDCVQFVPVAVPAPVVAAPASQPAGP